MHSVHLCAKFTGSQTSLTLGVPQKTAGISGCKVLVHPGFQKNKRAGSLEEAAATLT